MATPTPQQLREFIKTYAEVGGSYPGVYILGCFARYVTLYSQQVRALNLVYALTKTGALEPQHKVAVIGAGAAGLTAAAALAHLGHDVTLLEEFQDVLNLQAACQHRWIHPHIYDWPYDSPEQELQGDQAGLPLLDWEAGIASDIAGKMESAWKSIARSKHVHSVFLAKGLQLGDGRSSRYKLSWNAKGQSGTKDVDHLIVAVGFGQEPKRPHSELYSYWHGDNFDDGPSNERWLISGFGDGALTDLMRCCIWKFKHADVVKTFLGAEGIDGLKYDLRQLRSSYELSDEEISQRFRNLGYPNVENCLRPILRTEGPEIFLTGTDPHLYGPGSSSLNRLIVLLLARLGAFTYLPGPTGNIVPEDGRFRVELGYPMCNKVFDRVIIRHGTQRRVKEIERQLLTPKACDKLESAWGGIHPGTDFSRRRHWPPGYFGPEGSVIKPSTSTVVRVPAGAANAANQAFTEAVKTFGVKITNLAFYKELRGDGSSTVTYSIEGLSTMDRPIHGVHFYYQSIAGKIGPPVLDSSAVRLGMQWEADAGASLAAKSMEELRQKVRKIYGTVRFAQPLLPTDPPLTFSLKIVVLNGDALSEWEFDQLYELHDRVHVNWQQLNEPIEYFARFVWCPVETLKLQVTLPADSMESPTVSTFSIPADSRIDEDEILRDSLVQLYPPAGSVWTQEGGRWEKQRPGALHEGKPANERPSRTWELTVAKPAVGTCYSLDWKLPDWRAEEETKTIAEEARDFRARLLKYAPTRRKAGKITAEKRNPIRKLFQSLHRKIVALQKEMFFNDTFDIALMTYDDEHRRLEFVDGTCNGRKAKDELDGFWLPFGLGLAGTCFKQGDRCYFYYDDQAKETQGPEPYLTIPGKTAHRGMVAVPLVHPDWYGPGEGERVEYSRMCVGVIDISFENDPRWLKEMRLRGDGEVMKLRAACQDFSDQLCDYLSK